MALSEKLGVACQLIQLRLWRHQCVEGASQLSRDIRSQHRLLPQRLEEPRMMLSHNSRAKIITVEVMQCCGVLVLYRQLLCRRGNPNVRSIVLERLGNRAG